MGQARKDRAKQWFNTVVQAAVNDQALQVSQGHNFTKLVQAGVIIEAGPKKDAKPPKGDG